MAGADYDGAAREAFTNVIVGIAVEAEFESIGKKCAEALAGGAVEFMGGIRSNRMLQTEAHAFAAEVTADTAMKIVDERGASGVRSFLMEEFFHFHAAGFGNGVCCGTTREVLDTGMTSKASRPDLVSRRSYQPRSSVSERTPSSAMRRRISSASERK